LVVFLNDVVNYEVISASIDTMHVSFVLAVAASILLPQCAIGFRPSTAVRPPTAGLSLQLIREAKVKDCVVGNGTTKAKTFEASGVIARNGSVYIVLDNLPYIAVVDDQLGACNASQKPTLIPVPNPTTTSEGYEAITM
jgi:hypothetical protein